MSGIRALVVDDSGTMRKIVVRSLNSVGVKLIVEAGDGREALQLMSTTNFDLVLTDWNMPNMNGLELLKAIRGQDGGMPVIMITTESERTSVIDAIQAGVTDYLTKPFTPDTLRAKLEKHLAAFA